MFIRYLSTGLSFRNLAVTLRMGASTVGKIVHETCKIIWEELVEDFMPVPNQDQLLKISDDFYRRWKFPNCIGCIDGKHCQIKCPINSGSSYFNYLKYFSLVLQGVADADKKFIFIEVGSRGKQSDGGTFAASTLFQHIQSNTFLPPDKELPGTTIKLPHVFIGDEAYPLKTFLMRPFPSRNLNAFRENYNKRLSAARKCIECAFGILRAKWRILGKDIEVSSDKAVHIIKCACILHNVVREKDGDSDLDYCQEMLYSNAQENQINNLHEPGNHGGARRGSTRAQEIRNEFANFFLDH